MYHYVESFPEGKSNVHSSRYLEGKCLMNQELVVLRAHCTLLSINRYTCSLWKLCDQAQSSIQRWTLKFVTSTSQLAFYHQKHILYKTSVTEIFHKKHNNHLHKPCNYNLNYNNKNIFQYQQQQQQQERIINPHVLVYFNKKW